MPKRRRLDEREAESAGPVVSKSLSSTLGLAAGEAMLCGEQFSTFNEELRSSAQEEACRLASALEAATMVEAPKTTPVAVEGPGPSLISAKNEQGVKDQNEENQVSGGGVGYFVGSSSKNPVQGEVLHGTSQGSDERAVNSNTNAQELQSALFNRPLDIIPDPSATPLQRLVKDVVYRDHKECQLKRRLDFHNDAARSFVDQSGIDCYVVQGDDQGLDDIEKSKSAAFVGNSEVV